MQVRIQNGFIVGFGVFYANSFDNFASQDHLAATDIALAEGFLYTKLLIYSAKPVVDYPTFLWWNNPTDYPTSDILLSDTLHLCHRNDLSVRDGL